MKLILSVFIVLAHFFAQNTFASGCTYFLNPESVQIGWTAYKTNEKVGVNGVIRDMKITSSSQPKKNFKDLLALVHAQGDLNIDNRSDSGNPARDQTLFNSFFRLIAGSVAGSMKHISGDDQKGKFQLKLSLNKKSKFIPMEYSVHEGVLEARGEFNMNDYALQKQLASLHHSCEELHKGKDGVSKTWPNVGLKLTAKIVKDCKVKK